MKKLFLFLIFTVTSGILYAHPHIYIDMSVEFEVDDAGIAGFRESWTIQKDFGKSIIKKYDKNADGIFDPDETAAVKLELFDNIKNYNYYTYLTADDKVRIPLKVTDFSVGVSDGSAVYNFFVPCRLNEEKEYRLTMHDLSRYVSFGLRYISDPGNSSIEYSVGITRDPDHYSHSNMFGNAVLIIKIKRCNPPTGYSPASRSDSLSEQFELLTEENMSILETISNPFVATGIRIKDDNPNPFMTY